MNRFIVVLILSLFIGTAAYSVIVTSTADPSATPLMTGVAIAILVLLIAFRWVTAEKADKGLLTSIYTLIPGIVDWCIHKVSRSMAFSLSLILLAAIVYWVGPHSVHRLNFLTGDAAFLRIDDTTVPAPSSKWLTKSIWLPAKNLNSVVSTIHCRTKDLLEWAPTIRGDLVECGEALSPSLISNGIDTNSLDLSFVENGRIISGVKRLRNHLESELPERNVRDRLLIATWNIRDFGRDRHGMGPRLNEAYYYIAEIISHFDIVAVQEVQSNTAPIERIMKLLGPSWRVRFSLVSPGRRGNNERMAYFYDRRKLKEGPLVASIVTDSSQLARIPYTATFNLDDARITFCSVHIYYGSSRGERRKQRITEIKNLSQFLVTTKEREPEWNGPLVFLGDFSSPTPNSPEIEAIRSAGFYIDPDSLSLPSNYNRNRVYDQIALLNQSPKEFLIGRIGVFDYFSDVFRDEDQLEYRAEMGEKYLLRNVNTKGGDEEELRNAIDRRSYYSRWVTYQMSDHFPKWIELRRLESNSSANSAE